MNGPTREVKPPSLQRNAEGGSFVDHDEDANLVVLLMYQNHLNLLALEEALSERREALP